MNGQPVKEKPWKAGPSELHLALSEAGTVPPQVEPPPSGYIRKRRAALHTHTQAGSSKNQALGEEELLTALEFLCVFFFFFSPNTLLIDEPIISLPKSIFKT